MKNIKKISSLIIAMLIVLCGCSKNYDPINVGLVLTVEGPGDESFNDNSLAALERAKLDYKINYDYKVPTSMADIDNTIEYFAKNNYDLVIVTGFLMHDACESIADKYPETDFIIIDSLVKRPNVKPILFNEKEGAFVAGAVSALVSRSGNVGFIGGMDLPFIKEILEGFRAGVQHQNTKIRVASVYLNGENPFNDPLQANKEAEKMINEGIDIIFHIAGNSGIGIVKACSENRVFAIGEKGQYGSSDDTILANIVKNPENAVYRLVVERLKGEFDNAPVLSGFSENGISIDFYPYKSGNDVSNLQETVQAAQEALLSGKISIE
ncbi:MAG TPA: BMP family ABC transporter substrate-binding protein [Spirochaetota bacterium]|nr:BMP family ABC transporter substrate-binding protein [Spirochaetota bacterium]